MRSNALRTSLDPFRQSPAQDAEDARTPSTRAEEGRRAILAGWVMTMLGIVAYIVAMSRAGGHAGIMDAITGQGALGWASAGLILGGVAVWFAGNLRCLQAMADMPGDRDD